MFPAIILLLLLSTGVVYVNKMPMRIRTFAATIPGRIIVFSSVIAIYQVAGWVAALLATLFGLLLISSGEVETFINYKMGKVGENFSSDIDIIEKKPGTKWWDEVILGRESVVKTNLVDTLPVQG